MLAPDFNPHAAVQPADEWFDKPFHDTICKCVRTWIAKGEPKIGEPGKNGEPWTAAATRVFAESFEGLIREDICVRFSRKGSLAQSVMFEDAEVPEAPMAPEERGGCRGSNRP